MLKKLIFPIITLSTQYLWTLSINWALNISTFYVIIECIILYEHSIVNLFNMVLSTQYLWILMIYWVLNWIQLLYLCWVLNMSIFRSVLEYIYLSKNLLSAQSVIPFTLLLSTQCLYFCTGAWVLNKSKFCMEIEWISYNHFSTQFQTILCIYWMLNISIFE